MPVLPDKYICQVDHAGHRYRGRITEVYYRFDEPTTVVLATDIYVPLDMYGVTTDFSPPWTVETAAVKIWKLPAPGSGGGTPGGGTEPIETVYTDWMVAPMSDPTELWIDVAFPQGLIWYFGTANNPRTINVDVEFKRTGDLDAQHVEHLEPFTSSRTNYLRRTDTFKVADLGLTGSGPIEVRLKRITPIDRDDATNRYVDETRWAAFRAVKILPERNYDDVTVVQLGLQNTRAASALGENTFNCIATRVLPSWSAGVWSPAAATDRWADNFVSRVMSDNGARKTESEIDLAGIYSLQQHLDDLDESSPDANDGAQGKISMTLDQIQDIEAELVQVADVVRAVVYRVGKKLFVTRDEATAQRIALFNGRTKNSDGEIEAVRLTNDGENDGVVLNWVDAGNGFKMREYTYSTHSTVTNPLRVSALSANWPQAFRRARFEWNKIRYRRKQITVNVTEDGRICRPGDVVNVTDDIANLAANAGEVLFVSGLVLTLDRDVSFVAGHSYTIVLRDVVGQEVDTVPVLEVAGSPNKVQLARAPVVTIKPRDTAMGTLYAFYDDAAAIVRPWLLTGVST